MPDNTDRSPASTSFATTQVQAGYVAGTVTHAAIPPIYQSNAFEFTSLTQARELFALQREGDIYSRAANPTVHVFEQRVAALEGGVAAAGVASGQAAVALSLLALVGRGGHIVAAAQLYGGTVDLLTDTFPDWGIETTLVDQDDAQAWRDAVRPATRAFFAESVANPIAQVLDVRMVADIAHEAGVPLVIDNTVATPYLQRPREFGADR
jgi:O-acetylhomoserine (thiol)-lyase